ncbi:MAG: hypothetical protein GY765_06025 [bacterium]|nr:hypothetical protein [bacterium]
MKKAHLSKKLELNKITIAGLDESSKGDVIGGAPVTSWLVHTCINCTTGIMTDISKNPCGPGSIYPVSSEPVDLTC